MNKADVLILIERIYQSFNVFKAIDDNFLENNPYILEECKTGERLTFLAAQMVYVLKYCHSKEEPLFFNKLLFELNEYSKCKNPNISHLNVFKNMSVMQQKNTLAFLEYLISSSVPNWVLEDEFHSIQKMIVRLKKQTK